MDAIELLEEQHDEVEEMFDQAEKARTPAARRKLFERIGDALAVHAAIEEKIFYPAAMSGDTEDQLMEAVEEHLAAKRLIADLIALDESDEHYRAKLVVLAEEIRHHVREERKELFPKAKKILDKEMREQLGMQMQELADNLKSGTEPPRMSVPAETEFAASLT
jgi:hemerythrin-like domain-containing protein